MEDGDMLLARIILILIIFALLVVRTGVIRIRSSLVLMIISIIATVALTQFVSTALNNNTIRY